VTDGAARIAKRYPVVWHVIEAEGALADPNELELLPAAELRRYAGCPGAAANRDDFEAIELGEGRLAVLRPQQMPDQRLARSLGGAFTGQPDRWRQHVDCHIFFWACQNRRDRFVAACRRDRARSTRLRSQKAPVTLAVNTAMLLGRYGAIAYFATFNTGSTVRGGATASRNEGTYRPIADYCGGKVAELAMRGSIRLAGIVLPMSGMAT
jgi:hypothetical protein